MKRNIGAAMVGLVFGIIFFSIFELKGISGGASLLMTCIFCVLFIVGLNLVIDSNKE